MIYVKTAVTRQVLSTQCNHCKWLMTLGTQLCLQYLTVTVDDNFMDYHYNCIIEL